MNRRRLILSAAGAGLAVSGFAAPSSGVAALAATDDELAYANFGQAAELLLKDFYARAAAAKLERAPARAISPAAPSTQASTPPRSRIC